MADVGLSEEAGTSNTVVFFVNGRKIVDDNVDPEWTLLTYLREHLRLTGAKLGCGEGGCGACTVMLSRYDHEHKTVRHYSINACLTPVASIHGMAVTTVEGIGSLKEGLHAVQDRLAKSHGSQCGFCTPGIVMSMYVLLRNKHLPSIEDITEHLTGNLCRCTGYRSILDGFSTFTGEFSRKVCSAGNNCCQMRKGGENAPGNNNEENAQNFLGKVDQKVAQNICATYSENGHHESLHNGEIGTVPNSNEKDIPCESIKSAHNSHGCHSSKICEEIISNKKISQSGHCIRDENSHANNGNGQFDCTTDSPQIIQNIGTKIVENATGNFVYRNGDDSGSRTTEEEVRKGAKEQPSSLSQSQPTGNETIGSEQPVKRTKDDAHSDDLMLMPYDPTQEIIFPPELKIMSKKLDSQSLFLRGRRITYVRPLSLSCLLHLKHSHPMAKLIVGNTELGIEVAFKNQHYPMLINPTRVSELRKIEVLDSGVKFGAAVTLTELQESLKTLVETLPEHKTRTLRAVLHILKWFAGQQIRNTASIGGNIMTTSPISDLNPIFVASGVTLTFASLDGKRELIMNDQFFTGYRKNSALSNELLETIFLPFSEQDEFIKSYKQSRRRDDDIAIVNAAMKVRIHPGSCVLADINLVFGGMAAKTVTAPRTMKELVGCKWDESLLDKGFNFLLEDLPLSSSAPGGMVEYRRSLTLSFFFKFYLSVREWLSQRDPHIVPPLSKDESAATNVSYPSYKSSTQRFERRNSRGDSLYPVGQPFVHASAFKQVSGEAIYVDDLAHRDGELFAACVVSSRANARILQIDETEALEMEGVVGFFSAKDLPGERNKMGALVQDEDIFARDEVPCVGQVVALVVAKDQTTARLAAKKVSVKYEEISKPIVTTEDAIKHESWWNSLTINKGNIECGFEMADHILEGEMHVGGQEHFYLEPNTHIAIPKGEDDEIEIFTCTQTAMAVQKRVANALGIASNRVVVKVKRLGGAFGGKETRPIAATVPVALAAFKLQKPVRITLDRQEDMLITGGRNPFLCRWKVGFTAEGRLTALDIQLYCNAGCTQDISPEVLKKAMLTIDNAYRHENIQVKGYVCKTHLPSNTAFRGFGAPQATIFAEDIMERMASFLKIDPVLIRELNMLKTGDVTFINHLLERCTVDRCWAQIIQQSQLKRRTKSVKKFNRENTYRKRGLAATPVKCGVGFNRFLNQAGALIHIYTDGSVLITHGGVEMGQGLHTKMIQVASQVLQIPPHMIHISETTTDKVPNSSPTAASISSDMYGMAIINACNELSQRLKPYVTANPKGQWKDWISAAYFDRVSLSATGFHRIEEVVDYDFKKQCGQPFYYYCNGAAVTEVEIDCLTGDHQILRTDLVMDVGNSLNPAIDIGQVEGAFVQGAGYVTLEELRYSPDGVLLTKGPGAYKIPGFQDIPCEFNVSLLKDAPNPWAIFSSKAVGEPPLLLATSVFQAIKAAIGDARADQNLDPVFRLDSPATAERIRMACQGPIFQKLKRKILSEEPSLEKPWSVTV